jgi:hypothetical protein
MAMSRDSIDDEPQAAVGEGSAPYAPPQIVTLGTLAELTAGGEPGEPDDGFGAGLTGSV